MDKAMTTSRRTFVAGAACAAGAGLAAAGLAPSARAAEGGYTFADTVAWNAEYDVVVVGFGGAGGVASIYAADNGARVLLCDGAPEGDEGGNTRFAAQMCVSGEDPDKLFQYYKEGLAWHFDIDSDTLRAYTDGLCDMGNLMKYIDAEDPIVRYPAGKTIITPEYPEYLDKGGDTVVEWFVHDGGFDSALWKTIRAAVEKRADSIDVWLESPATHMVQDPQTKTVVGVEIERGGEALLVRAKNGVVLACGGFENNPAMIQDYIGAARLTPFGTTYNKGDGIKFGREVGADMWHMDAYESIGILSGNAWATDHGRLAFEKDPTRPANPLSLSSGDYGKGSILLVGDDGSRFIDENASSRHGHVYSCGVWRMPIANWAPHLIFDQAQYEVLDADGYLTEDRKAKLVSAETAEELAELIGADAERLAQTIADFNFYAETGRDYHLGRDPESMRALEGTLYAAEFRPGVLNTQGGPRRNANAEVLDVQGNPIPHLYSAGELGGICAFQYNSGGNLGECMVFGKIAGTNAAAEKDPLAAYEPLVQVETDIRFQPGDESDLGATDDAEGYEVGENQYIGSDANGIGGKIVVRVTYKDGTIEDVEVLEQNETPEFGGAALEELPGKVVEANSCDIDGVVGATITSNAFFAAVQNAISQA